MNAFVKKFLASLLLCLMIVFVSCMNGYAITKNSIDFGKIDGFIKTSMENGQIPGLSLGIVSGDQVIYLKSYGVANPQNSPVSPQTAFHTGSVGKTFTALAVRQLANQNKIDYTAPVQKYIPWFHTANAAQGSKITIEDLLAHQSGFSRLQGNAETLYDGNYGIKALVEYINTLRPEYKTGVTEYSNINFILLGFVIEQVTGQAYQDYIAKNVFKPLEMKNSFFSDEEASRHDYAMGHKVWFGSLVPYQYKKYPIGSVPAGFHVCSAEDMTHYLIAYLNNGYYKGRSIIPNNTLPKPAPKDDSYTGEHYNIYWGINQDASNYGHAGADNYFTTSLSVNPYERYGVIVLTNSRSDVLTPDINAQAIANGIMVFLSNGMINELSSDSIINTFITYNVLFILVGLMLLIQFIRLVKYKTRLLHSRFNLVLHFIVLFIFNLCLPVGLLLWGTKIMKVDISKIIYQTQLYGWDYQAIFLLYLVAFLVAAVIKIFLFGSAVKCKKNEHMLT